jgi:hypothetical protein
MPILFNINEDELEFVANPAEGDEIRLIRIEENKPQFYRKKNISSIELKETLNDKPEIIPLAIESGWYGDIIKYPINFFSMTMFFMSSALLIMDNLLVAIDLELNLFNEEDIKNYQKWNSIKIPNIITKPFVINYLTFIQNNADKFPYELNKLAKIFVKKFPKNQLTELVKKEETKASLELFHKCLLKHSKYLAEVPSYLVDHTKGNVVEFEPLKQKLVFSITPIALIGLTVFSSIYYFCGEDYLE